jgi:hypothetical protein
MSGIRNLTGYESLRNEMLASFVYTGTAELKRGDGMCFKFNAAGTGTGELATDPWGRRGQNEIAVPSASNANRFAGILTRSYAADAGGRLKVVELSLPGGCAMISQRVISTIGVGRVTCIVDSTAGNGVSGKFGYGGLPGRGSAVPLETLAAATLGDLAIADLGMGSDGVYASGTGLTTITLTGAGTALGYVDAAIDASQYECTVVEGATAAEGATRANLGVYPVKQATGANTFTVVGDTGDTGMMVFLTIKNMLRLAYLEDGVESGLSDYVCPSNGAARQFVLNQGGTTFIAGAGITTLTGASTGVLADPITIGGSNGAVRKAFNVLSTLVTSDYIVTVTSGVQASDTTTALATAVFDTAKDELVLAWNGNMGGSDAGYWTDQMHVGATFT